MARLSSRELALERRRALTTSGKKASAAIGGNNRVRTVSDARPTRTEATSPAQPATSAPAATVPQSPVSLGRTAAPSRSPQGRAQRHPSRELVLSRREALSRRGKSASTSRDRNRADVAREAPAAAVSAPEKTDRPAVTVELTPRSGAGRSGLDRRKVTPKRRSIENPSRALVLARRDAMSKHGKTAGK